ncbi:tetratricopeptide repeat-containing diguanylate cyclase [Rhodanobacter denitrificans]|uniref:tetratricopeptide repeat-containing diguanylate cyclase n=1 Tax=Rhodanobacter denitrificans TaxID=666685 RepID=UPI001F431BED|nr:GGDEF domain-containing protein [Rhodanobacter denitrificans]UJJ58069.1 GGDEF domain-containing protein [Rhodanobacter denitrificans]
MDRASRCGLVFACCVLLLLSVADAVAAIATVSDDPAQLLRQAENVEPSNHAVFNELMSRLDKVAMRLSPQQKLHLRYLEARRIAFAGDYAGALPLLTALADQTADPVLAFRASANVIDLLVAQSRFEEAFVRLNPLLDQLPQIKEDDVRIQGLTATAQLYTEAGQYDESMRYADQLIKESTDAQSACRGWFLKSDALFESGSTQLPADQLHDGTEACAKAGDTLFSLSFQHLLAGFDMRQGRPESAIRVLQANYPKVLRAGFPPQVAQFETTLATAYWKSGALASAVKFANSALKTDDNRPYSQSTASAYRVLYQVDKKFGDSKGSLVYLEKYLAAHDGYQSRLSAKVLAYQTVKQIVLAKKLQVEGLDKKNRVLALQGELDRKAAETSRLYVALLLLVLASIILWAYRVKRSQLRFMRLARRDGLTGIFNRQYFVNEAERQLRYCRKSARDVCLVLIDLDHFKLVNDTHGHAVGDRVLKRAVDACQAHLRSTDVFGRLGGEEFGVLLPECTLDSVLPSVEQMRAAIAAASVAGDAPGIPISASFGVAAAASSGYALRQLMIDADRTLYQAKHEGRNRISLFDAGMRG